MQAYPELAAEVDAGLSGTMLETLRPFPELAAEVEAALSGVNINSFRTECLRPVENRAGSDGLPQEPPFYERYGEKQVALGHYQMARTASTSSRSPRRFGAAVIVTMTGCAVNYDWDLRTAPARSFMCATSPRGCSNAGTRQSSIAPFSARWRRNSGKPPSRSWMT